jgi:hypothetical protein
MKKEKIERMKGCDEGRKKDMERQEHKGRKKRNKEKGKRKREIKESF